jgi:protein-S-isoprenylcysteine O-methyltransferase Ste14
MIYRGMRSRLASLLASAVFLVLAPGTVALYVPWRITRWERAAAPPQFDVLRLSGLAMAAAGAAVLLDAFWRFAWIGLGSPAPVLPTEQLVVSGFYRYVRNPMYVAVVSVIAGQALWFWSSDLLIYALVIAALFHLFVLLYEEPALRRQFGEPYSVYCRHVHRWLPRLRAWESPQSPVNGPQ